MLKRKEDDADKVSDKGRDLGYGTVSQCGWVCVGLCPGYYMGYGKWGKYCCVGRI